MFYITDNKDNSNKFKYNSVKEFGSLVFMYNDPVNFIQSGDDICIYYSQAQVLGLLSSEVLLNVVESHFSTNTFNYKELTNKYSFIFYNLKTNIFKAYTDLFKNINVNYALTEGFNVSDSLSVVKGVINEVEISKESIYHYLNFCYIPSPHTIYKGVYKLGAAQSLEINVDTKKTDINRYWNINYKPVQNGSEEVLVDKIKSSLVKAILQCKTQHNNSTFLSGGTDSTSITSVLSKNSEEKLKSYSIGFYEEEYSELEFVDIAQKVLMHDSTKYKLSADEVYELIFKLSGEFEEPFGNSSVLATYYCAKLSSNDNNDVMIAGDGGDEIFGGNERYAKDVYFQKYYNLPGFIKWPLESLVSILPGSSNRFINRVKNFIKRSNTKNPERFYLDDSFSSDYYEELLSDGFRKGLNKWSSLEVVKANYDYCESDEELNKLMQLDQLMAIAENDLMKVNTSCSTNDIDVLYPFLNRELVEFMATIPKNLKIHGSDKRYGFKKAVAEFTPQEILYKKKQGFGVPLSVWFKTNMKFIELAKDIFNSDEFISRDIFNQDFCLELLDKHIKGTWDYSQEIWIIINLELWLRKHL